MENKPSIFVENDNSDELHTGGGEGLTNQTADARGRGGLTNQKAGVVGCCPNLKKRRREKLRKPPPYSNSSGVDSQHRTTVVAARGMTAVGFFSLVTAAG
ncbi:hypothetical protein E3N88_25065 [Mikania micrantha]|uniref:Uncharacterized protein n=1 Tax=Mikania micrantha TaxID=192012 RepID=A0A5N6N451_9ASTR|nr:hypothetical protein E3N88_25065 [Mikania micrantha]